MKHNQHGWFRKLSAAAVLVLLTGCAVFRPEAPPELGADLPGTYSAETAGPIAGDRWWEVFGDEGLNTCLERVLSDNPSVLESWARLRQVQAEARKAGAALRPTLDLQAGASVVEQENGASDQRAMPSSGQRTGETYSLGLASTYEVDLWGRIQSSNRAARLAAEASDYDRQTAVLSLAATTVETWYKLVAQREQIRLLEDQLEANRLGLELIELRFRRSLATALDVFQQRQAVARVEAQVPLAEARQALLEHQLAVLMGLPPGSALPEPELGASLPEPGDLPSTGLPADLLMMRPDVRAGWMRMAAAGWGVSAARADRLPALRIAAEAGYTEQDLSDLFNNWVLTLAGNLTAPLIDGGRRKAEVERTLAVLDERLATYRGTVLNAFREVEDALARERFQVEHLDSLDRQLTASRQTYTEAVERYRFGLSDYLPAITALATSQNLENIVVEQRLQHVLIRVALYRALGGNWMEQMEPPEDPTPRLAIRSAS